MSGRPGWDGLWDRRGPAKLRVGALGGAVTLACSFALLPVIDNGWWVGRSAVVIAVLVLAGALMRVARVPVPLLPVGSAAVLLGTLVVVFTPEHTRWRVIPEPSAIPALRDLLEAGRADAWASVPPAAQTPGLALIIVGAVGLVALMVDTLTAGLDLPGLALAPLGALYVAPWVVGAGFPPTASFLLVVGSWVILLAGHESWRVAAAMPGATPGPSLPWVAAVAATAVIALALGSWLPQSGTGKRGSQVMRPLGISLDPVVSLRRALVRPSGGTVMTYQTSALEPGYFRLAVLESFDGRDWRASDAEPGQVRLRGRGVGDYYELSIGPLAGSVIPSPAEVASARTSAPVALTTTGLAVRADGSSVTNTQARLRAQPQAWTAEELSRAATASAGRPANLAADPAPQVGPELGRLAAEVTAGATNPFERALALQDWFTTNGGFSYSTSVGAGPEGLELQTFLLDRVGYCEQFAATMALMARTLGIPARVAVGFTPGLLAEDTWTVRDSDAHAWPELWLGGAGWVRFEPTPRSDSISTPPYARTQGAESEPEVEPSAAVEPSAEPEPSAQAAEDDSTPTATGDGLELPLGRILAFLGFLVLLASPGLLRARRRAARMAGLDGPAAGTTAYREVTDTMVDLGVGGALGATERETFAAIGTDDDASTRAALARLCAVVERERYGPALASPVGGGLTAEGGGDGSDGSRRPGQAAPVNAALMRADLRTVRAALWSRAAVRRQILAIVLPRSLWR